MTSISHTHRSTHVAKRVLVPIGLALLFAGAAMVALRLPKGPWVAGIGLAFASLGVVWQAGPPRTVTAFSVAPAAPGLMQFALTGEPFAWFVVFGAYPFALGLGLGIGFEEHDPTSGSEPGNMSIADIVASRSG